MALDGPVDGPDLNLNLKLCDVLNIALDGPVDGLDLNLNLKLCRVFYIIVRCFKYFLGRT